MSAQQLARRQGPPQLRKMQHFEIGIQLCHPGSALVEAAIQASNAKRDLDSARQKEKVEWEQIMRVYGPPSDYDPNEDDHDDYPSSVGESIDENDMKGFTSDSNDDGSNASADDSSDMSENDDSVSIRGKHAQGRISAGSKAPGAKDKKMLPAKSATSTSDYPTPPWSCRLS